MFFNASDPPGTRRLLAEGLVFPESPRWRHRRLWFSDIHAGAVMSVGLGGDLRAELRTTHSPSGLGWTADGDLLVVSMEDRLLLRHDGVHTHIMADLSDALHPRANDLIVGPDGSAYVGGWGYDLEAGEAFATGALARVDPSGVVTVLRDDLSFPNGMAWVPEGLLVTETMAARLVVMRDVAGATEPAIEVWADLPGLSPDGIAVDRRGGAWVADAAHRRVVRVERGGLVTDTVEVEGLHVFACALGGEDQELLFLCCAPSFRASAARKACAGVIEVVKL